MRSFLITASLALASAAPAYNYQPQHLNTNTIGLSSSNNPIGSIQGHPFLQDALQSSQNFLEPALSSQQNFALTQQPTSNLNGQQLFTPHIPQSHLAPQQEFNYQTQPIAPVITKDIYVHAPPEEPEENYHAPQGPILPPRKHYRIVFIKAPTQHFNPASLKITQAPTEEKTIIYVLSKKPDPLDLQAVFKDVAPSPPSKPEVYFIKYKTQEEAAHAQRSIQAQFDKLGGTSEVSDEGIAPVTSVIGSLQNQQQISQPGDPYGQSTRSFSNNIGNEESSYLPPNH